MNSPIIGANDPMVQQAMQAQKKQMELQALIKGLEAQIMTNIFAQLALEHYQSEEELTLEDGREMAETAAMVCRGYAGFLFEKLGMAKVAKVDDDQSAV